MTVPFSANPLLPLVLTIGTYLLALRINRQLSGHPLANPVLITVAIVIAILSATGVSYERYFQGAQFIHFLLGPATVALAVPLYRNLGRASAAAVPILAGIAAGAATAVASVMVLGWLLEGDRALIASLATKTVTAPVALGIAGAIGGIPPLAATFAVLTGMAGAALGPSLLDRLGVVSPWQRGVAMGVGCHGIGTARILQESEEAGACASLAMGVTALLLALTMPSAARFLL